MSLLTRCWNPYFGTLDAVTTFYPVLRKCFRQVALLGELLARFLGHLRACTAALAPAGGMGATTGGALAGWHRAAAVCVQALSLLAERVADQPTALRIAGLLLPLTLELDPVGDAVPMHRAVRAALGRLSALSVFL